MTTSLLKLAADFDTQLATASSIGATTATLVSATDDDGNALPTGLYGLTIDAGNSSKEYIICTLTSTALTGILSVTRQGVTSSGFARTHRRGAKVTLTDWAILKRMLNNLDGTTGFDSASPLSYDGNPTFTADGQIITKKYADDLAIAGSPDASTTVKGISKLSSAPASPTEPIAVGTNDTRVPTQDENDALAGTSGTPSSSNKYVTNDDTSVTGSGSKIPRGTGGKIDKSWLPSGVLASIASGENLVAGNPVYLNPGDSALYKAHGFKELDSTALNLTASTTNKIAKLSATQMMFLTNSSGTLTITVYDINSAASVANQTVTTGLDTTGLSTTLTVASVCRLTDTTFVVFYVKTSNSDLYFRTGTISGGTITMDTETQYTGSPDYVFGIDTEPGAINGKVVLSYLKGTSDAGSGGNWVGTLSYLTVTTNSVTVSNTVSSSTYGSSPYNAEPVWSVAQFTQGIAYSVYCISNSGGTRVINYSYIDTVSGNTQTDKPTVHLENEIGSGVPSTYSQYRPYVAGHNGKIYFGWAVYGGGDAVQNVKTLLSASTTGSKIEYQSTTTRLGGDTTSNALPVWGNEMGVIASGFNSGSASYQISIYIQKEEIYSFYSVGVLGISNRPQNSAWYSNLKDEIVLAYIDGSFGYVKQWRLPTLMDGFANTTVTAPATTELVPFVSTSGLTANAKYYLKDTYTNTGELATYGTIPVGHALSTTVINSKL